MVKNFSVKSNDYMYVVYVSSLIRSILSLHDLVNNKIQMKEIETENARKEKEREAELAAKKEEAAKKKVEEALKKSEGTKPEGDPTKDKWIQSLIKCRRKSVLTILNKLNLKNIF